MQTTTIDLDRDSGQREPESWTADPTKESPDAPPVWTPAQRVLFRFTFAYLVLYIFPFPVDGDPNGMYANLWHKLVPWVGKQVFHVEITVRPNGSGDTTYNYVQVFCFAVMAAVAAAAWTLLDRKRTAYPRLDRWLRVYVRFDLAATMITYGSVKVIKSQFPDPHLDRLLQPFGDASPMGLLWTFMGASESYNIFTGAGEILGGLLLTTRRTTLLGSLVCFGLMSHVAMLNFSYDVPVKLFSMHLLAMALFLMAPDLKRLARMFVLNRPVDPVVFRPLTRWTWVNRGAHPPPDAGRRLVPRHGPLRRPGGPQDLRRSHAPVADPRHLERRGIRGRRTGPAPPDHRPAALAAGDRRLPEDTRHPVDERLARALRPRAR